MRRFDKLKSITKANLLSEQRYIAKLNESTDIDLIKIITNKIEGFSIEDSDFDRDEFSLSLFSDKIEGIVMNGMNIDKMDITITGSYDVTSHAYYTPGKHYGPPEDSYPDESGEAEFDIVIKSVQIGSIDEKGDVTPVIEFKDSDIQKLPKEFTYDIEGKVSDMLLNSGKFDPNNKNDDYDGPDDDDY